MGLLVIQQCTEQIPGRIMKSGRVFLKFFDMIELCQTGAVVRINGKNRQKDLPCPFHVEPLDLLQRLLHQ